MNDLPEGWAVGGFTIRTDRGPHEVAGWVKGAFALDFRPIHGIEDAICGWHLTHVPTGWAIVVLQIGLARACALVDDLAAAGNFSLMTVKTAKLFTGAVKPWIEPLRAQGVAFNPSHCLGPGFEVKL